MDKGRYPAEWTALSKALRAEQTTCEWCDVPNGGLVIRTEVAPGFVVYDAEHPEAFEEEFYFSRYEARITKIVLTVAHLGTPLRLDNGELELRDMHDKADVRRENLVVLYQRCHLWLDLHDHMRRATETRAKKSGKVRLL